MNTGLTVTALARASEITVHAVRHYTQQGLLKPTRNPGNRYRLYRPRDVGRLRFIRDAQRLGFGLKEVREILADAEKGQSPCPRARDILRRRIDQNREQLEAMRALQARMERALEEWQAKPDGIPTGDSVCYLIESFDDPESSSRVSGNT